MPSGRAYGPEKSTKARRDEFTAAGKLRARGRRGRWPTPARGEERAPPRAAHRRRVQPRERQEPP
eukprot:6208053-Prymnesium_polylepis.1